MDLEWQVFQILRFFTYTRQSLWYHSIMSLPCFLDASCADHTKKKKMQKNLGKKRDRERRPCAMYVLWVWPGDGDREINVCLRCSTREGAIYSCRRFFFSAALCARSLRCSLTFIVIGHDVIQARKMNAVRGTHKTRALYPIGSPFFVRFSRLYYFMYTIPNRP